MANYLSLEEAAKKLGIPADRLVQLRSQGEIRGFRDGASWKFPDTEIDRLADELPNLLSGGSGVLVNEQNVGTPRSSKGSKIIGGDNSPEETGSGSDVELGMEPAAGGGSDVNLITGDSNGSDVLLVASGSGIGKSDPGLLEIGSSDLSLDDAAILHDSGELDLDLVPQSGSTGPITDDELKEIADSHPDAIAGKKAIVAGKSGSDLDFDDELGLADDDDDSDDMIIGGDDSKDMLLSDDDLPISSGRASSLELMSDFDSSSGSKLSKSSIGGNVLSELDLLSEESGDSGLISGDSEGLLGSSGSLGLGSDLGVDDALDDDDDLMIADDDDDLVISNSGGDISIAGDSGINLMSPSDSGLSLESEPLDLASSSVSALDLGSELSDVGSGKSSGKLKADGSVIDFEADEEFQLSPSGIGLEMDIDSGSQVIEVEDSDSIGEPVEFGDIEMGGSDPFGGDVFGDAGAAVVDEGAYVEESMESEPVEDEGVVVTKSGRGAPVSSAAVMGYEVPFTLMQVIGLTMILFMLSIGGMLMTDLIRNLWTYQEPSAPVSSLTDSLISLMGWDS